MACFKNKDISHNILKLEAVLFFLYISTLRFLQTNSEALLSMLVPSGPNTSSWPKSFGKAVNWLFSMDRCLGDDPKWSQNPWPKIPKPGINKSTLEIHTRSCNLWVFKPNKKNGAWKMILSFWDGLVSGSILNFQGVVGISTINFQNLYRHIPAVSPGTLTLPRLVSHLRVSIKQPLWVLVLLAFCNKIYLKCMLYSDAVIWLVIYHIYMTIYISCFLSITQRISLKFLGVSNDHHKQQGIFFGFHPKKSMAFSSFQQQSQQTRN